MTWYGLDNVYHRKYYWLKPFLGVWTLKMHYLGQYCKFCLFSNDFSLNSGLLKAPITENDLIWLATLIIGNTMDGNRILEFGHLKCIIWVNTVNFASILWFSISALNSAQIGHIECPDHRKRLDMVLITFIIWNAMDWNRY